jgi:hypothetical protein
MKAEKKLVPTKARIRVIKERERRLATALFLALILFVAAVSAYFTYAFLNRPENQTANTISSQLKAAIVDQLSLTFPNRTFIQAATDILKKAGYTVDYYSGEEVTVEVYRNLPTHAYKLIILRVHSTTGGEPVVTLFTSEPYSQVEYVYEQCADELRPVAYSLEELEKGIIYFGMTNHFVESSMKGTFSDTMIIEMGCEGLKNTKLAEAFVKRGAEVYIGWNDSVSADRTDTATMYLLKNLMSEGQTIKQALKETMKEAGSDLVYNSLLTYYPLGIG